MAHLSAGTPGSRTPIEDDRAREACPADHGAVSALLAAARRAVATQARRADTPGSDSATALVAPLLALWSWLESTRPGTGVGTLSADRTGLAR